MPTRGKRRDLINLDAKRVGRGFTSGLGPLFGFQQIQDHRHKDAEEIRAITLGHIIIVVATTVDHLAGGQGGSIGQGGRSPATTATESSAATIRMLKKKRCSLVFDRKAGVIGVEFGRFHENFLLGQRRRVPVGQRIMGAQFAFDGSYYTTPPIDKQEGKLRRATGKATVLLHLSAHVKIGFA